MKKNKKPVIAYLFTHWDAEWYRTVSSFNVRLVEVFDKVLDELENGLCPAFYFDGQVLALLNYLKYRPEKENLIKKLIQNKKLFIGPFFASADNFLVSGVSLIRNLSLGLKISKDFGCKDFLGYLSDTFGHSKSIFKILNLFNIKNAIIWRGAGSIDADFKTGEINTTRLVFGYYQDVLHNGIVDIKKAHALEEILDKINKKSGDILLLPLGADHMGVIENSKGKIQEINKLLKNYEIKLSTPFEYFKRAKYEKEIKNEEFLDNSTTYILPGVYSTRIEEKVENAKLQFGLFYKTEVLNYFLGSKYNSELNYAAIELIKNHAHDSIYGCSTDDVHKMVRARQVEVKETLEAVNKNLVRDFKFKNLLNDSLDKIGVFNFSNYIQNGVVEIISDKKIKNAQKISSFNSFYDDILTDIYKNPMTEDFHTFYKYLVEIDPVKPFSFKNFEIKPPAKKTAIKSDFIENENLKLFVLDNKIYVLDKKENKLYSDFIELHSTIDNGDSYNYAPACYPEILKIKGAKVKINGKIKSTLQILFEENIKLNFSLTNNSKLFEIEADFNNKKKNRKLQIVFNTGKPVFETMAQDAVTTIKRLHDPNYLLFKNTPVQDKSELKTNSYPMQGFVSANDITVFTIGLNEYEIYKNSVKIALLRSTGVISNPKNTARGVPAGPPVECPDMQGLGKHNLKLAFTFNSNEAENYALADNFYNPFLGVLGEFKIKEKTFIKNDKTAFFAGIQDIYGKNEPLFIKS